ncbi:MAG TPA: restriction endonuclease subunit S [Spirochaetota bacterium]|nr:restriction endonuclease subunit S [Spirochaetota bacterium]HOS31567.1 restriction endonuclease subunit S [Spirochaetota bacterium]HOS54754.1 restriction endonuclease subunit S [Spirochaetota bacterium]HQF77444.1 restriction endonuclease subunit S [Spirochaetota bacterium]HQH29780.1 restriction endonuclease subunit S [Spirochaetota bacterium]
MNIKTYKLAELLTQYREIHFVENDQDYKQITISKYSGVSYRGTKNGKHIGRKRQFIVNLRKYPHTLLFTRQGVKDGSIGIAPKDVDGCIATENMPMFSINTKIILPELLASWLNSEECKTQLDSITPTGSAQKAIHERDLLKIHVSIPENIEDQKKLINILKNKKEAIEYLNSEIQNQSAYLTKLRQSILQEAIEGKLTLKWRKEHPICKGNPDYDAETLLEKIQVEKEKLIKEEKNCPSGRRVKKKKALVPIKAEEIPFKLPNGWVWTKLGEICSKIGSGSTPKGSNYTTEGYPFFRSQNIYDSGLLYDDIKYISNSVHKNMHGTVVLKNDLLLNITGGSLGRCALVPNDFKEGNVSQHVCIIRTILSNHNYFHFLILSPLFQSYVFNSTTGAGRKGLPKYNLELFLIPLPPLAEQQAIVDRVEKLLAIVDELEKQVIERKEQSEQLMQAVLREAFEGGK